MRLASDVWPFSVPKQVPPTIPKVRCGTFRGTDAGCLRRSMTETPESETLHRTRACALSLCVMGKVRNVPSRVQRSSAHLRYVPRCFNVCHRTPLGVATRVTLALPLLELHALFGKLACALQRRSLRRVCPRVGCEKRSVRCNTDRVGARRSARFSCRCPYLELAEYKINKVRYTTGGVVRGR